MIRGANLKPWLRDPKADALFAPAELARVAATGMTGARIMADPTAALTGQEPATTLAWRCQAAAARCVAAGLSDVIICLDTEDSPGWRPDDICADPAKVQTYRGVLFEVVHALDRANVRGSVEVMNEPQSWGNPALWNATQLGWVQFVRKFSARPLVVSGPCSSWAYGQQFFDGAPYASDPSIRFSAHFYGFKDDGHGGVGFTHQSAPWVAVTAGLQGVPWSRQPDAVVTELVPFNAWAAKYRVDPGRILLTEFGCLRFNDGIHGCALPDAAQFYADALAAITVLGFGGWCVFNDYPGDFQNGGTNAFSLRKTDGSGGREPTIMTGLGLTT